MRQAPRSHMVGRFLGWAAGLALAAAPGTAPAQVADALPQAAGVAGNYTALARGLGAIHWNPAGLGMPDNPRGSVTVLPVSAMTGLGPIGLSDVTAWGGREIPHETRLRWLERIQAGGGQKGHTGAEVTYLGLSVGRLAVSASSGVVARANVAPDVAELLLFGNAGMTGQPRDYTLAGSELDLAATTTFAVSIGVPVPLRLGPLPSQAFALGATVKYTIGHFLLMGREQESVVSSDPLEVRVRFPMIHTWVPEDDADGRGSLNNGSGVGLDLGAAWSGGTLSAGIALRNVVSTFRWDEDALRYRQGTATWTADSTYTDFDERPFRAATADLVAGMERAFTYDPVLAAGLAARIASALTVVGEVRHAMEDNLYAGERTHVGVGADLRAVTFLPLRAGLSLHRGGYRLSGGIGLRLGSAEIGLAGALVRTGARDGALFAAGLNVGLP